MGAFYLKNEFLSVLLRFPTVALLTPGLVILRCIMCVCHLCGVCVYDLRVCVCDLRVCVCVVTCVCAHTAGH